MHKIHIGLLNGKAGSRVLKWLALGLLVLQMISVTGVVEAADGAIDPTFGSGGKVTSRFTFFAVAIQSDGKIVAAGEAPVADPFVVSDFGVARYNSNGSLDPNFGSGGEVTTHFPIPEFVIALAIQADGKIIAAGALSDVVRYTKEGALDTTFGSGGKVKADIGVFSVAVQSDGKIILAGVVGINPGDTDFALVRYDADGSLDSTFGLGGKVITPFSSSYDYALDVMIQQDGKVIAVGYSNNTVAFALARYNTDGSLDPTFGSGGKAQSSFSPFANFGAAGKLQRDGKILVGGTVVNQGTSYDFALARYRIDGSLDPTFGSGGFVTTDFNNGDDLGEDIAVQADGKILVVGRVKSSASFDSIYHLGIARYNGDGSLDMTFGSGGRVTTIVSDAGDGATGVAIQNDGRIVVAGNTASPDFAGVLVRYDSLVFDTCIQDDSNGNVLQINLTTGVFQFSNCRGVILGGTGSIVRKGCYVTLQVNGPDRRVLVNIDTCANRGTASIQLFSRGMFTILDRDTANNTCSCSNHL